MIGGGDDWQSRSSSEWNLAIHPSPSPRRRRRIGGRRVSFAYACACARARARVCRRRPAEDSRKIRTHAMAMPFDCISDEPSRNCSSTSTPGMASGARAPIPLIRSFASFQSTERSTSVAHPSPPTFLSFCS